MRISQKECIQYLGNDCLIDVSRRGSKKDYDCIAHEGMEARKEERKEFTKQLHGSSAFIFRVLEVAPKVSDDESRSKSQDIAAWRSSHSSHPKRTFLPSSSETPTDNLKGP